MNPINTLMTCLAACLMLASSCSVYEKVPNAQFRGPTLKGVQAAADARQLHIDLGLRFLFSNPFNKPIVVPEHQFTMLLNGKALPGQLQRQPAFELAAQSERLVTYTFTFDLSPSSLLHSLDVLGKDNYYAFAAEVEIDLQDLGIKIPTALGKLPLRKHKLEFAFGDTIRLPLLPIVQPAEAPAQVRFLGELETFNLEPIKNAMTPMVDLLLDTEFDSKLTDPFAELLFSATVPVYSPTWDNPFRTVNVNLGNHIVNTLLSTVDGQAPQKWEDFKKSMMPGQVNLMDHFIAHFLAPLHGQAPQRWEQFKTNWEDFKERPLQINYPGPRVTGLQIAVPLRIYNPNSFEIQAPIFFGAASAGGHQPLSFLASAPPGGQVIPAKTHQDIQVRFTLDWAQGGTGLLGLLQPGSPLQQTRLLGTTSLDLGYGPMRVELDLPLSLQSLISP